MLEVKELSASYGDYQVLHDVSLSVEQGEIVALFGPNGHGKSTLLKSICGLVRPIRGSVVFQEQDLARLPVPRIVDMGLIYVPEERHLFTDMSVLDNLQMGAYTRKARRRFKENLEFVFDLFPRLEERRRQLARTLSGGEAQMLAMGRGLMSDAAFLAIDEPSLGLAPNLVEQLFNTIARVNEIGKTVLLVEQNCAQACGISERVYLMEEGRMVLGCPACDALENEHVRSTMLGA